MDVIRQVRNPTSRHIIAARLTLTGHLTVSQFQALTAAALYKHNDPKSKDKFSVSNTTFS